MIRSFKEIFLGTTASAKMPAFLVSMILVYLIFTRYFEIYITPLEVELDSSYSWAFNFYSSLSSSWDHVFTFGPLGFLVGRFFDFSHQFEIKIAFEILISGFSILGILWLVSVANAPRVVATLLLGTVLMTTGEYSIFFSSLIFTLALAFSPKTRWPHVAPLAFVSAICLLVKLSLGVAVTVTAGGILFVRIRKRPAAFFAHLILTSLFLVGLWVACGLSLESLSNYIANTLQVIGGYSSAMSNYLQDWHEPVFSRALRQWQVMTALFAIAWLFAVVMVAVSRSQFQKELFVFVALGGFFTFKHSITRVGAVHCSHFPLFLMSFCAIFITLNFSPYLKKLRLTAVCMCSSLLCLAAAIRIASTDGHNTVAHHLYENVEQALKSTFTGTVFSNIQNSLSHQRLKSEAISASLAAQPSAQLPKSFIDRIGNATTDVYPYQISLLPLNHLQWQGRPVAVSFQTYTKKLMDLNSQYLSSGQGAKFFVFDSRSADLDDIFHLWVEPTTIIEITRNYEVFGSEGPYTLLQAAQTKAPTQDLAIQEVPWSDWIDVPHTNAGQIYFAKVFIEFSPLAKLRKLFLRQEAVSILLQFNDGTENEFRFIPETAVGGLIINPFPRAANDYASLLTKHLHGNVRRIQILPKGNKSYVRSLKVQWSLLQL